MATAAGATFEIFEGVDAFVNLAGVSLNNGRWTKSKRKQSIGAE